MLEHNESETKFFRELDDFQLHMPGNRIFAFSNGQNLLDMVERQYPDWKEEQKITSIPVARIPKVFLHNLQKHQGLQKKLKSTVNGEEAEAKLYRLFVDGPPFKGESGMIVFPNFDGSLLFKSQIAKVEIDMVLVHPKKGVFVFNVKNENRKGTSSQKMEIDIERHKKFLQLLKNYKATAQNPFPIHTIICDFANNLSKFTYIENNYEESGEKVIVFCKSELNSNQFSQFGSRSYMNAGLKI